MDEKCRRDIQDHAWLTHELSVHSDTLRRLEDQIAELERSNVDLLQGSFELSLDTMRWGNFSTYKKLDTEPVTLTLPPVPGTPPSSDATSPHAKEAHAAWQSPQIQQPQ
eukprot:Opistho-2@34076